MPEAADGAPGGLGEGVGEPSAALAEAVAVPEPEGLGLAVGEPSNASPEMIRLSTRREPAVPLKPLMEQQKPAAPSAAAGKAAENPTGDQVELCERVVELAPAGV